MKVIVNDNDQKRSAMNENACHDETRPMGRVGGKYDFIMMVGDGDVYGFVGEKIYFTPIGDQRDPIGFQWEPALNREVDFKWLPLDGECDDEDEHWVPFEDMLGNYDDDEDEYDD